MGKGESMEYVEMLEKENEELRLKLSKVQAKIERYEKVLIEINKQTGLLDFLDKNDWAIPEDYCSFLAKEVLNAY